MTQKPNRTKKVKRVRIKGWAIVYTSGVDGVAYGSECNFGLDHEHFLAVFESERQARLGMKFHKNFYKDCKVVPCTITYKLPKKKR